MVKGPEHGAMKSTWAFDSLQIVSKLQKITLTF